MKRILGKVDKKIAERYNLEEYAGKSIVMYDNDRKHCLKHKDNLLVLKFFIIY